ADRRVRGRLARLVQKPATAERRPGGVIRRHQVLAAVLPEHAGRLPVGLRQVVETCLPGWAPAQSGQVHTVRSKRRIALSGSVTIIGSLFSAGAPTCLPAFARQSFARVSAEACIAVEVSQASRNANLATG